MASTDQRASDPPTDLDALAHSVAAALDAGDDATAWDIVVALEELAGPFDDDVRPPAAPVIARRFARAHRRTSLVGKVARMPVAVENPAVEHEDACELNTPQAPYTVSNEFICGQLGLLVGCRRHLESSREPTTTKSPTSPCASGTRANCPLR